MVFGANFVCSNSGELTPNAKKSAAITDDEEIPNDITNDNNVDASFSQNI